ncbi:hypothetical protein JZ785_06475 [Alicyclobacillus curvatus]|jgi:similar to spore coat protein|nr:hypothetical protein JZ785_06475 [Alicyclobacillus curvatus]
MEPDKVSFALHETLELHELLAFKNVCLTKSITMPVLVNDGGLKDLLAAAAAMDRRHVADLQGLLARTATSGVSH